MEQEKVNQRVHNLKGSKKHSNVKPIHVVGMILSCVVAVFVIIQVTHIVNYTLGNEMDINKMWLYKWVLNLTK